MQTTECLGCNLYRKAMLIVAAVIVGGSCFSAFAQDGNSGGIDVPPPFQINDFELDWGGNVDRSVPPQEAPDRGANGAGLWEPGGYDGYGWADPAGAWVDGIVLPRGERLAGRLGYAGFAGEASGVVPVPAGGGFAGIPEPASLVLLAAGATLALRRRR